VMERTLFADRASFKEESAGFQGALRKSR